MNDIEVLAKRVEALTGPNREVDKVIARSIGFFDGTRASYDLQLNLIPHYTASLDAAMSLVREKDGFFLGDYAMGGYIAQVRPNGYYAGSEDTFDSNAYAATPALALTAAALRARAAEGEG